MVQFLRHPLMGSCGDTLAGSGLAAKIYFIFVVLRPIM